MPEANKSQIPQSQTEGVRRTDAAAKAGAPATHSKTKRANSFFSGGRRRMAPMDDGATRGGGAARACVPIFS